MAHRKKYGDRLGKALHDIAAPEPAPAGIAGFRDQMPVQTGTLTLSLHGFQSVPGKEIRVRKEWTLGIDASDPGRSGEAPPLALDDVPASIGVDLAAVAEASAPAEIEEASAVEVPTPAPAAEAFPAKAGFVPGFAAEPVAVFVAHAEAVHHLAPAVAPVSNAGLIPALKAAAVRHCPALFTKGAELPVAEPVTSFVQVSAHTIPLPAVLPAIKMELEPMPLVDRGERRSLPHGRGSAWDVFPQGFAGATLIPDRPTHAPALARAWVEVPAAEPVTAFVQASFASGILEVAHTAKLPAFTAEWAPAPLFDRERAIPAACEAFEASAAAEPVTTFLQASAATGILEAAHTINLPAFTAEVEPFPLFDHEHAIPAACEAFEASAVAEPVTTFLQASAATGILEVAHTIHLPAFTAESEPFPLFDHEHAMPAACEAFEATAAAEPVAAFVQASASAAVAEPAIAMHLPAVPAAMVQALPAGASAVAFAGEPAMGGEPRIVFASELRATAQTPAECRLPGVTFTAELEPLPAVDELAEPPVLCEAFLSGAAAEPAFRYLQASVARGLEISVAMRLPETLQSVAMPHVPRIRVSQVAPFAEAVMAEVVPIAATAPLQLLGAPEIVLPEVPEQAAAEQFEKTADATHCAPAESVEMLVTAGYAAIPISIERALGPTMMLAAQTQLLVPAPVMGGFLQGPEPAPLEAFLRASVASARGMGESVRLLPLTIAASQERILPSFHAQQLTAAISRPAAAEPRREEPRPVPTLTVVRPLPVRATREGDLPQHGLQPLEFHTARLRSEPVGRPEWIAGRMPLMPPRFAVRAALDKLDDPVQQPKPQRREPEILNMPAKKQTPIVMMIGRVAAAFLLASSLWYGVTNFRSDRRVSADDLATTGPALGTAAAARPNASSAAGAVAPLAKESPRGGFSLVRQAIAERASLKLAENFQSTRSWEGLEKAQPAGWQRHPDGYMNTGALALFSPTLKFKDYRMEFFGQIESKSIGWTVRSTDTNNYHAMKLTVVESGIRPFVALVQYNVVDGKAGRRTQTPLNIMVHNNRPLQFTVDVKGNRFVTFIDGEQVDAYTDSTLTAGGVGLFSEAGERARLYWLRVARNDDWLGHVCAMLADTVTVADLRVPAPAGSPFHGLPAGDDGLMLGAVWFGLPYLRAARKSAKGEGAKRRHRDGFLKTWSEPWNS
ncbi:MAG: hypothetical protein ABI759_01060 [Candidatus Solibacter sp.]